MRCNGLVLVTAMAIRCVFESTFDASAAESQAGQITTEQRDFFENHVRPILAENCLECHSSEVDEPEGSLRLDSRVGWARGGDSGPAIVPGNPEESLLVQAIRYQNADLQMPPDGKLDAASMELLVKWIAMGAPDPRRGDAAKESPSTFDIQQRRSEHWAWQPIRSDDPPSVKNEAWPSKPLDRYILARLEEAGLSPAPPVDRAALLRRVTFDLIGLPPTPVEVNEFLIDDSELAYQRVVDRLLDSPHFGEHWGQHWLDLVRYAETRGHEQDFAIPEAYRFRDYVILACNENVPYDQILMEHLAGDLMEPPRLHPEDRTNQSIQGTGFWHLHEQTHSPVDIQGDEADRMHNQIDVFSRAFLGLSVGCARCHDHKFDPISTRDYYAMYGYLQSSSYRLADVSDPITQRALFDELLCWNDKYSADLVDKFVALRVEQLKRFPSLLRAAAELLKDGKSLDAEVEKPAEGQKTAPPRPAESVSQLADERTVEVDALWRLAKHLKSVATGNSRDPLHVFARAATSAASNADSITRMQTESGIQLAALVQQAAERQTNLKVIKSVKDGERNYKPIERPWSTDDVVEDFAFNHDVPDRWITDGYRFGQRPQLPGAVLLSDSADQPLKWFLDTTAAQVVSNRFGGFIRTRTFEVVGDRLWYRYRGSAQAFLAVDSHRVVAGPLHGVVKQDLPGSEDVWQWFSHNVRDYIGHRVHVEFTPTGSFALDRVVFAADQPPVEEPIPVATREISAATETATNLEGLAQQTADALIGAIGAGPPDAPTMNWLVRYGRLMPAGSKAEEEFAELAAAYASGRKAIEDKIPAPVLALALLDGDGEDEPVHIRGNHRNRAEEKVPRRVLEVLRGDGNTLDAEDVDAVRGSGRLQLARTLVHRDNPLVARVFVNRIWHHLLGRGIVETVDDFGVMGVPPTHPVLLDHLATQFVENGWSIKDAIRDIVLSSTYQMSSYPRSESTAVDPANRLFHRMPVRRLPAESIRDHILAVSGRLDQRMFGKSTMVHITPFMRGNRSPEGSGPLDGDGRRSIYTEVRRNHLSPFLTAFDKPAPFMAIGKRSVSNSPAQSLILLNDPFVHEQARIWAEQLLGIDASDQERLEQAYSWAFSRPPTDVERDAALEFVASQQAVYAAENENKVESESARRAWADLCHTLFNVKEFVHIN